MKIEVGVECANLEQNADPERVLYIFESTVFLVCTTKKGASSGIPYLFPVCPRIGDSGVDPLRLTPYATYTQSLSCQARRHDSGQRVFSDRLFNKEDILRVVSIGT